MKKEKNRETAMTLRLAEISPAERNVHGPELKDDSSFRGLLDSIKTNGIIHRLIVRRDEQGDGYILIDGHRRYAAAKEAGIDQVPVEVREGVDETDAMAIMLAANVQRLENDPILEAEVIESMMGRGYTVGGIAAVMGKTDGYVARRARLTRLTEPWKAFARRVPCTIDMLEKIAAHEPQLQDRVAADVGLDDYDTDEDGGRCDWSEFKSAFREGVQNLDEAIFDTAACDSCQNNTGCHTYLFDFMNRDGGDLKYCQFRPCFMEKHNAQVDLTLAALKRKGKQVLEVTSQWSIPEYWNATATPTRKNCQAYLYEQSGLKMLRFSVKRTETAGAAPAMTAEEREAQTRERKARKLLKSARDKLRDIVRDTEDGARAAVFSTRAGRAAFAKVAETRLVRDLGRGWFPDELVDDLMTELAGTSEVMDSLTDEEYEAYIEKLAAKEDGEGTVD